ncbi:hypothetical protein SADUNF_Sadunf11G0094800 [Salix dunnii]|uniref:Uncharacterized protein n=1 Tax=Salix dunnii TaxID=1413687 RepID=A0A835MX91_9ROSI|nr:hypothetical protein SADUNF_Sadunf11G0094800 [Salix dunnii]
MKIQRDWCWAQPVHEQEFAAWSEGKGRRRMTWKLSKIDAKNRHEGLLLLPQPKPPSLLSWPCWLVCLLRVLASNRLRVREDGGDDGLDFGEGKGNSFVEPYIVTHNIVLSHAIAYWCYQLHFKIPSGMKSLSNVDGDKDAGKKGKDFGNGWQFCCVQNILKGIGWFLRASYNKSKAYQVLGST